MKINIIQLEYANPVPPIYGGAIEELLNILLEENIIKKKLDIRLFVGIKDKKTMKLLKPRDDIYYIYINKHFEKIYNFFVRFINKIFKILKFDFSFLHYYYKKIMHRINEENSIIIFEGSYVEDAKNFKNKFGKDNIYLHVHSQIKEKIDISLNFGHLISVSKFIEDDWKSYLKNSKIQYHTLYNSINQYKFLRKNEENTIELKRKLGFNAGDFIVVFCGRIIPEKGVLELIESIKLIKNPKIKLLIIGSPNFAYSKHTNYLNKVMSSIKEVNNTVKFTGYVENDCLYKYYQVADIQVIPSIWEEAAGLVAIEGMVSGLPLIITNSGGLVEYANNGCSVIVEKDSNLIISLKNSILELYTNKQQRNNMKKNSLKNSMKFYKEKYYDNFVEIMLNNTNTNKEDDMNYE